MSARSLVWFTTFVACVHEPARFKLDRLPVAPNVSFVDSRLGEQTRWGRFEEVFDGDIQNLTLGSTPASLAAFDGELTIRLLDLRWTWRNDPFFLAQMSGVARIQVERKPRSQPCRCSTLEASAIVDSEVGVGNSMDEARRLVFEALLAAFRQLEVRAQKEPCPEATLPAPP